MVKIKEYTFGEVRFCDCLNKDYGIPSLKRDFEFCLTDPPYNVDFNNRMSPIKKESINNYKKFKDSKVKYNDSIEDYPKWSLKWVNEVNKISDGVAFTCGTKYHYDWIRWKKPSYHEKYWYKSNSCSYIKADPILFYGKIKNYNKIRQVIDIPINLSNEIKTIHSSPKPLSLYKYIIEKVDPISVIDPFLGSGTTAEVCEMLGIEWLGFEIKEIYLKDIQKRLRNISIEPRQRELTNYI